VELVGGGWRIHRRVQPAAEDGDGRVTNLLQMVTALTRQAMVRHPVLPASMGGGGLGDWGMAVSDGLTRRKALGALGGTAVGLSAAGLAMAPPAQAAALGWTQFAAGALRLVSFQGLTPVTNVVGMGRWAKAGSIVYLQFLFRTTGVPATGNFWALDARIGVAGAANPPAADVMNAVLPDGSGPYSINLLGGEAIAHHDGPSNWFQRGSHARVTCGFEPGATPRYVLMAHDRSTPDGTGFAYLGSTEPFAWAASDVLKGFLSYPTAA
jgi:hypothetical protein